MLTCVTDLVITKIFHVWTIHSIVALRLFHKQRTSHITYKFIEVEIFIYSIQIIQIVQTKLYYNYLGSFYNVNLDDLSTSYVIDLSVTWTLTNFWRVNFKIVTVYGAAVLLTWAILIKVILSLELRIIRILMCLSAVGYTRF